MDQPTEISTSADGTPAENNSNFDVRQPSSADSCTFVFTSFGNNLVVRSTKGAVEIV